MGCTFHKNDNTQILYQRLMIFGAFIFLCIAVFFSIKYSLTTGNVENSIVPYNKIVFPALNCLSAFACFILIFNPKLYKLQLFITFIQSISTLYSGISVLGSFLYLTFIVLSFVYNLNSLSNRKQTLAFVLFWFLCVTGTYTFGLKHLFIELGASFYGTFFIIFSLFSLRDKFGVEVIKTLSSFNLPKFENNTLNLQNYSFTERQIKAITILKTDTNKTYKEIASDLIVSPSVVKKEMLIIFKKLGIKNLNELKQILTINQIHF